MLDGLKLEQAGVPTAAIVTEPFAATGRAMAGVWGVQNYRFLVTTHPIANLTDAGLNAHADRLVGQVIDFFRSGPSVSSGSD